MDLEQALSAIFSGKKVKLPEWAGYWFIPEDRLTIENLNIFAQNEATGVCGDVSGATFNTTKNGAYSGPYALFAIHTNDYENNGKTSRIKVGDVLLIAADAQMVNVIRKDDSIDYAHYVYIAPQDENYTIKIYPDRPMTQIIIQMNEIRVLTKKGDVLDTPWLEKYKYRGDFEITEGNLGFDFAILALLNGKKVTRKSWISKENFIYNFLNPKFIQRITFIPEVSPFIGMVSKFHDFKVDWKPSSDDMEATDVKAAIVSFAIGNHLPMTWRLLIGGCMKKIKSAPRTYKSATQLSLNSKNDLD